MGSAGASGASTGQAGAPSGGTSSAGASTGGAPQAGGSAPIAGSAGTTVAGGASNVGGAPAGGSGGSSAGSGGSSAGAAAVDTTLVGSWDGALMLYPCGATGSGYDCKQPAEVSCKTYNQQSNPTVSTIPPANNAPSTWTMGGTPGTNYSVTFRVRGIVEVTSYVGGTRLGGASVLTTPRNLFQAGGTPQTNGGPSFDYNTYELSVSPAVQGEPNLYFLNSVTTAQNPHAGSSPTSHLTFDIDYTATIKVPGGGKVTLKVTDSNCTQVQNCGPTEGNTCQAARSVPLDGAMPPAPTFNQPYTQGTLHGQWVFFDITKVTVAQ